MANDDLTVLVFKDNYTARTFHVPLAWISRFGFLIGLLAAASLLSSFLAIKYYRSAVRTDPGHVQDLEQELGELRNSYQLLEAKAANAAKPLTGTVTAAAPVQAVAPQVAAPIPTVTVTVTPPPVSITQKAAPATPVTATTEGSTFLFHAFPGAIQAPAADAATTPTLKIHGIRINYRGRTLYFNFNLQYVGAEGGSEQGRIIILARGTDRVMAYPSGVLNLAGKESLISPEQGEYFSVSRVRAVKADFGPLYTSATLKELEVILLGANGQVLLYQKVNVPGAQAGIPRQREAKPEEGETPNQPAAESTPAAAAGPGAPVAAPAAASTSTNSNPNPVTPPPAPNAAVPADSNSKAP